MKCTVVVFVVLTVLHLTVASVFDIFSADRVANKKPANIKRTPINDDLIKRIHNKTSLFKAKTYRKFEGLNKEQLRRFLGTRVDPAVLRRFKRATETTAVTATPPARFMSSTKWPKCKAVFENIQNQGNCAASWAVATTGSIADRMCIRYNAPKPKISAWDLLSCCEICMQFGGNGCDGYSHPIYGAMHYIETGISTGAGYQGAGCKPFPVSPDNVDPVDNTTCQKTCRPEYVRKTYPNDLSKGRAFSVRSNETLIRNDIAANGPAIATFEVYEDFYSYESGIYEYTEGEFIGVQSVRIIGWGQTAAGVKFWKIANSWGADWGEAGLFRIRRGNNECDIESFVVSLAVS